MLGHRLNAALTVYRPAFVDDGAGGRVPTFTAAGTLRAQVSQPSAAEREVAAQLGAELSHVVHTTYGADVQRGDELDTGEGERLRVVSVVTDSRRTYTRLECVRVQHA